MRCRGPGRQPEDIRRPSTEIELRVNDQKQFLRPPLLSSDCTVVLAPAHRVDTPALTLCHPRHGCQPDGFQPDGPPSERYHGTHSTHRDSRPPPARRIRDRRLACPRRCQRRHEHMQVTASAGSTSDSNLFTSVPDLDLLESLRANQDPAWIPITLRVIGQMIGRPSAQPGDTKTSWVNLAWENDPRTNRPRAWVNLEPSDADMAAWKEMEDAAVALAKAVAGSPADIQNIATSRNGIGTTHHEAGTLWMGAPGQSVTDASGKFHHLGNAYVAGPALFPVIGSANPSLTATTLARLTADAIITSRTPGPSPAFKPLFTDPARAGKCRGGDLPSSARSWRRGRTVWAYSGIRGRCFGILSSRLALFHPTTNVPGGATTRHPASLPGAERQ